jgi:glycosyltransferase involved in cell wall biosynthesis
MESIVDNQPYRLMIEKDINVKNSVEIQIRALYKELDRIAIWINENGPVCRVGGTLEVPFKFNNNPKISIITPVYKPKLNYFKAAIESVLNQIYDNWELILVDDLSKDKKLYNYIESLKDSRIVFIKNNKNLGIALASNIAIEKATGEYCCLLDHDDLLSNDALLRIADTINSNPSVEYIYSDEDKVNDNNEFFGAFYKPDWNYHMFLSYMYPCHLATYKTNTLKKIKGFKEGYDGSQNYDLTLRVIENVKRENIAHIPSILYHWRIHADSTSAGIQNKPDARINAQRAIKDHLNRLKKPAIVSAGPFQGHYRVQYKHLSEPSVAIIMPFKDQPKYLENYLYTIQDTAYSNYTIYLVDDNSTNKNIPKIIKKYSSILNNIKVLHYKDIFDFKNIFNFSKINNYAVKEIDRDKKHDFYLFMNNDMEIMSPDWLSALVNPTIDSNVAVVGGKLLYLNHLIQHAGIFVGINGLCGVSHKGVSDYITGYYSRPHIVQEMTAVTGACMLVRSNVFKEVGGFEEDLPKAFNDIDLCLKIRSNNHLIIFTPYCRLYHHESISRGLDSINDQEFQSYIKYMMNKWYINGYKDPYYNINLSRNCESSNWNV